MMRIGPTIIPASADLIRDPQDFVVVTVVVSGIQTSKRVNTVKISRTLNSCQKENRNYLLFLDQFLLLFPLHPLNRDLTLKCLRMCIPTLTMHENARSTSTSIFCTEIRAIVFYEATNNIGGDASIEGMISTTEDIESIRHIRDLLAYE